VNAALRRMGYDTKTEHTGHGFRAMARTILHEELGFDRDVIEHQLAHRVPDPLGTAYNRTKFLRERKAMMQRWADYLDKLKKATDVVTPSARDVAQTASE
ncbi:MAG: tyrosine-type recombinase/integrase, partial [Thiohalomonadaceae bacterium]